MKEGKGNRNGQEVVLGKSSLILPGMVRIVRALNISRGFGCLESEPMWRWLEVLGHKAPRQLFASGLIWEACLLIHLIQKSLLNSADL